MGLSPGTRLGPYEILSPLGSGGMGEVYRARDTRLGRIVAVKVLPVDSARDARARQRLELEARAVSSLNHPRICALYDVGSHEETDYLVMEFVEGRTLADILAEGPLPLEDSLRICSQIADGLAAAHAKGILHRDLKPSNVQVTPAGEVKLLDFGIAKTVGPSAGEATQAGTLPAAQTREGTAVGTPQYMSPEQVRGQPIDAGTDLWSLGCILYEMLGGRRAFEGETVSSVLVATLEREPDWSALPPSLPGPVPAFLRACLEKDARRRLRDASRARRDIDAMLAERFEPPSAPAAGRARRLAGWTLAAAVAVLVAVWAWMDRSPGPPSRPPATPMLTQVTFAQGLEEFPAWSPDAGRLAYSADSGGVRKIFLKDLEGGEPVQLTRGDHDDIQPAWSPDGATILFVRARAAGQKLEPLNVFGQYTDGDIWAVDAGSGKERKVIEDAFNPAWSPDGSRIAVDASWVGAHRIWLVDDQGRNPVQLTSELSEAVSHVRPRWSADGGRIVFQSFDKTMFDLGLVDVSTGRISALTDDPFMDLNPVFSPDDRFIYFSSYRSGGLNIWRIPIAAGGVPSGRPQQVTTGAGQDVQVELAGDGTRLAFAVVEQNADLWRLPVDARTGRPTGPPEAVVATTREDSRGGWSPDGRMIAFNSDRSADMNIWIHDLDSGSTRQLTRGPGGDFQPSWSPDGTRVVFFSMRSGNPDIWTADIATGELRQLTTDRSNDINPFYSLDGRWIAYQSDEGGGRMEVWVMREDGSGRRPLTVVGVASSHFLRWTGDGRFVIFRCLCGGTVRTMKAPLDGGEPIPMAEVIGGAHMSLSPDGSLIMDVSGHKVLWVSPLESGAPEAVFEFEDGDVRIDYPSWSPAGDAILFDRFLPRGGDIWMLTGLE